MEELILFIVKNIVSEPEQVKVTSSTDSFGKKLYELETSDKDRPFIIGRKGSTINAIRKLVTVKDPKAFVKIKD